MELRTGQSPREAAELPSSSVIKVDPNPTAQKEAEAEFSDPEKHRKHLSNKQYAQDIRERRKYAIYAYRITRTWARSLVFVVFLQIVSSWFHVGLSENEFIAIITTTTASMFGFWWLVGKYLFATPERPKQDS